MRAEAIPVKSTQVAAILPGGSVAASKYLPQVGTRLHLDLKIDLQTDDDNQSLAARLWNALPGFPSGKTNNLLFFGQQKDRGFVERYLKPPPYFGWQYMGEPIHRYLLLGGVASPNRTKSLKATTYFVEEG